MELQHREIPRLKEQFLRCRKTLVAIGDPTRQQIILAMLSSGSCGGVRVGEITAKSHLSRPAVSHHLGILRDAGLINMRREGTKNYYYFDAGQSLWKDTLELFQLANELVELVSEHQRAEEIECRKWIL